MRNAVLRNDLKGTSTCPLVCAHLNGALGKVVGLRYGDDDDSVKQIGKIKIVNRTLNDGSVYNKITYLPQGRTITEINIFYTVTTSRSEV